MAEPLPADHRGPRGHAPASRTESLSPPLSRSTRARAAGRGAGLPLRLRPRRGARGPLRASRRRPRAAAPRRPRRSAGGCSAPSAATASGSSCSGRSGGTTGPATAGWSGSPSGSACRCVATGNVHMHDPSRAPLQDALVAVRLRGTLEETEPGRRGNALGASRRAGGDGRPLRATIPRRSRRARRLAERLRLRPHPRPRLPLPGLGGSRRRSGAGGDLPGPARAPLRAASPSAARRGGGWRRSCEVIRSLRLSGFFLLHFDILELAREVAAEVRGPDSARGAAAAGARAGARASARSSAT